MEFQCFYVSTIWWRFNKIIKHANNFWQHEALKGAYVHEMTLCVTFLAPHFRTHFRFFIRCSKSTVIHMLPRTHVPRMTMCVTFRARLRSIPLGLLDRPLGHFDPKAAHGLRNGSIWRPFGPPTSPKDALQTLPGHACGFISTSSPGIFSVGEGAMPTKRYCA